MNCPTCNLPLRYLRIEDGRIDEGETLLGYASPPGHNHNDNCLIRFMQCQDGHRIKISKRRTCPACDWKGKDKCDCHHGLKYYEWPEEA